MFLEKKYAFELETRRRPKRILHKSLLSADDLTRLDKFVARFGSQEKYLVECYYREEPHDAICAIGGTIAPCIQFEAVDQYRPKNRSRRSAFA